MVIKFGNDLEAVLEDEQSAARLILALKNKPNASGSTLPTVPVDKPRIFIPPSPLQDALRSVLTSGPQTTRQLITAMEKNGYEFTAQDKIIAINSALSILEERGEARVHGIIAGTNQKLWTRGEALKSQP